MTRPVPLGDDSANLGIAERLVFGNRLLILFFTVLLMAGLGYYALHTRVGADFERMIPKSHTYIKNWKTFKSDLGGLGNSVRIAVAPRDGDIYEPKFLATLRAVSDEVFLLPGVDRTNMRSIWTPNARWTAVTESGLDGGPIIPNDYAPTEAGAARVRANLMNSNEVGLTVALDHKSALVFAPLLTSQDGSPAIDYRKLSESLEDIRTRYAVQGVDVHITGFAKVVGDLIEGMRAILSFFLVSALLSVFILYLYTRCLRSSLIVFLCSTTAVLFQLGLMRLLGFSLDPYLVLVPFLIFAIGMSHGAQKLNGIMKDISHGNSNLQAAKLTFRRLFMPGLMALLCDCVGFAVLALIDIQSIQDLALIASLGVLLLIYTNLVLLPILLSYLGVNPAAARRAQLAEAATGEGRGNPIFSWLVRLTEPKRAAVVLVVSAIATVLCIGVARHQQVGDLDPGAPELKANSRYNQDNRFINKSFGASADVFVVIAKTADGECTQYDNLARVDALEWKLRNLPGVDSTMTLASLNRSILVGLNEGSPKWFELLRNRDMINTITGSAPRGLYNDSCSTLPVLAFLSDHKADTLNSVVKASEEFAKENSNQHIQFLLAAGNAGIDAATNDVVRAANRNMVYLVYLAVTALCLITFRSWRATLCTVIPLAIITAMCEALMVALNIGVKVSTLPVIALGVGIGVDYALYIVSVLLAQLRDGASLSTAYRKSLEFTGRVVCLTGLTLAIAVFVWAFSPIKFQADMGVLLGFMFFGNMVAALVLIPALARFLLKPGIDSSIVRQYAVNMKENAASPSSTRGFQGDRL